MKRFTELFLRLDRTNKTNEKVELLKAYFISAPEEDKIWALALFTGRRPPRKIKTAQVQEWAMEQAQIPLVGSSRVDLQACKLEYSIVSPK